MKHLLKHLALSLFCLLALQSNGQDLHRKNADLPCLNKNFNVAVHVAVDSASLQPIATEEMVNRMMDETSKFFSPICVSFSTCEISIIEDNYSYSNLQNAPIGIQDRIRKMEELFSKGGRINVFVVDSIENVQCGQGTFNGILTEDRANVVIELNNCPDPRHAQNLAHQIGHLFGLYDTYNNAAPLELVDGSNCETAGDFLCDTPGDPFGRIIPVPGEPNVFITGNYEVACEFIFEGLDDNGEPWQPDMGNIMSAYPCKCGFTREQYLKMVEVYNSSPVKQF